MKDMEDIKGNVSFSDNTIFALTTSMTVNISADANPSKNMSCHVIVRTAYPFPWGCGVLLLEPIPALSQGEGRVLPG